MKAKKLEQEKTPKRSDIKWKESLQKAGRPETPSADRQARTDEVSNGSPSSRQAKGTASERKSAQLPVVDIDKIRHPEEQVVRDERWPRSKKRSA